MATQPYHAGVTGAIWCQPRPAIHIHAIVNTPACHAWELTAAINRQTCIQPSAISHSSVHSIACTKPFALLLNNDHCAHHRVCVSGARGPETETQPYPETHAAAGEHAKGTARERLHTAGWCAEGRN